MLFLINSIQHELNLITQLIKADLAQPNQTPNSISVLVEESSKQVKKLKHSIVKLNFSDIENWSHQEKDTLDMDIFADAVQKHEEISQQIIKLVQLNERFDIFVERIKFEKSRLEDENWVLKQNQIFKYFKLIIGKESKVADKIFNQSINTGAMKKAFKKFVRKNGLIR